MSVKVKTEKQENEIPRQLYEIINACREMLYRHQRGELTIRFDGDKAKSYKKTTEHRIDEVK